MNANLKPAKGFTDYKVADLALADWGRREIAIAESEMPACSRCVAHASPDRCT
jgi:adenosylhomocysteinase